jgi:hypothetical protein
MQRKNVFCIRLPGIKVGKKGEVPQELDITATKTSGRERVTWPRAQTKMTAGTRRVDRGSQ